MKRCYALMLIVICCGCAVTADPPIPRAIYEAKQELDFRNDPEFGNPEPGRAFLKPSDIFSITPFVHLKIIGHENSVGAGVIIDYAGRHFILTASHLTELANVKKARCYFKDNNEPSQEIELIIKDPLFDFAVFQFKDKNYRYQNEAVMIGDSDTLKPGDEVFALGSPAGMPFAISRGIIAKSDLDTQEGFAQPRLIVHTAAMDRGNSGGPLVDNRGRLIGINVMVKGDFNKFSLAVPINDIKAILRRIQKTGVVEHPRYGLKLGSINTPETEVASKQKGVVVLEVTSPAIEAGFEKDDLIIAYRGQKTGTTYFTSKSELERFLLCQCSKGEFIEFIVKRKEEVRRLTLQLE